MVRMPSALVSCREGFATTVKQNCRDDGQTSVVTAPFQVEPYYNEHPLSNIHFTESSEVHTEKLLDENLSKLRFDHMNEEEKQVIEAICKEYKDIFYCENIPLSFIVLFNSSIK